jgi:uncharacterized protein (TIGR02145 family)
MKNSILILMSCMSFYGVTQLYTAGSGVTDIDGNNYSTIIINGAEWMAENLRTTKYANGDSIPNVIDNSQWFSLTSGAWVHYNNDNQYEYPYGKLYNWYTVADSRNVCPTGWHVPSDTEWITLINYLDPNANGGDNFNTAGGKMKSAGTQYWLSPNTDATNESGFSGQPGGARNGGGTFEFMGYNGLWWSNLETQVGQAWYRLIENDKGSVTGDDDNKKNGFSVRCVKGSSVGIYQLPTENKNLIKISDLMGRETEFKPNTVLIYVYSDGTTERVLQVE